MTTLRQVEANRRNGALGKGPTTPEGKEQSRRNSLKHGLSGSGVVFAEEEAGAIERRKEEWRAAVRPGDEREEWLFDQLVVASVQIARCQHEDRVLRPRDAARASTCWDDDRRLAAEVLAGGLSRRPTIVSRQLRQTPQGC